MTRTARPLCAVCTIALAALAPSTPVQAARLHRFQSPSGFSLIYASPWRPRASSSADLLLLSPGRSVRGPIVGSGQAAILVRSLGEAGSPSAFDALIAERSPDATAAPRRTVHAIGPSPDCRDLVEVDTRDATGPGPVELDFSFYCHARARVVVIQVTHYAEDPKHSAYVEAALTLAGSLHVTPALSDDPKGR